MVDVRVIAAVMQQSTSHAGLAPLNEKPAWKS